MSRENNPIRLKRLYLAGPLFSEAELTYNRYLKETLCPYFEVYLPQEDGGLMVTMVEDGIPVDAAAQKVFIDDTRAIKECDLLLIVLDGRSIDEGAAFELGFAFALGKQCIGLQTDMRRLLPLGNNPMLSCAISHTFQSVKELLSWAAAEAKIDQPLSREVHLTVP